MQGERCPVAFFCPSGGAGNRGPSCAGACLLLSYRKMQSPQTSDSDLPSAVIFDFDGVLVDTEPVHYAAFQEVLTPLGLSFPWSSYERQYIGYDDRRVFREVLRKAGRRESVKQVEELIAAKGAAFLRIWKNADARPLLLPGVADWVRRLRGRIPIALCSGALPADIEPILDALDVREAFDVCVTAADTEKSKPDPEPYRLACERLALRFPDREMPPAECVAIEDTEAGVASARGAGLRVLDVTPTRPEGRGKDVWVVPSLAAITPEAVGAWCRL